MAKRKTGDLSNIKFRNWIVNSYLKKDNYLKPRCLCRDVHLRHQSFSFRSASSAPFESLTLCLLSLRDCHPPFRWRSTPATNSWRSRSQRYSLRSWSLAPPGEPVRLPTQWSAVFAPLTRRRKWTPARDRHCIHQQKNENSTPSFPGSFPRCTPISSHLYTILCDSKRWDYSIVSL